MRIVLTILLVLHGAIHLKWSKIASIPQLSDRTLNVEFNRDTLYQDQNPERNIAPAHPAHTAISLPRGGSQ